MKEVNRLSLNGGDIATYFQRCLNFSIVIDGYVVTGTGTRETTILAGFFEGES